MASSSVGMTLSLKQRLDNDPSLVKASARPSDSAKRRQRKRGKGSSRTSGVTRIIVTTTLVVKGPTSGRFNHVSLKHTSYSTAWSITAHPRLTTIANLPLHYRAIPLLPRHVPCPRWASEPLCHGVTPRAPRWCVILRRLIVCAHPTCMLSPPPSSIGAGRVTLRSRG